MRSAIYTRLPYRCFAGKIILLLITVRQWRHYVYSETSLFTIVLEAVKYEFSRRPQRHFSQETLIFSLVGCVGGLLLLFGVTLYFWKIYRTWVEIFCFLFFYGSFTSGWVWINRKAQRYFSIITLLFDATNLDTTWIDKGNLLRRASYEMKCCYYEIPCLHIF